MANFLYEDPKIRAVTGDTLRPGGFALTERAVEWCALPVGAKTLDVGCGLGATTYHLRNKYRFNAFGIDRSAAFLNEISNNEHPSTVFQAEGHALPFFDETFDAVISECVLSLIRNVQPVMKELFRVLAPGGYLIVSDIYQRSPETNRNSSAYDKFESCLNYAPSRDDSLKVVQNAGFEVVLWEDHSKYLKELAAKLIFEYGGSESPWPVTACSRSVSCGPGLLKPGYYLLIAWKKTSCKQPYQGRNDDHCR